MKSTNIPEVKLGIVAVSRDCFPIQLSEKRRAAIVAACQAKGLDLYEAKTTVENEKDMLKVGYGAMVLESLLAVLVPRLPRQAAML